MSIENIKSWENITLHSKELFKQSTETIYNVLFTLLFDIRSCFGRGYGYKYVVFDNGNPISIYDIKPDLLEEWYKHFKNKYMDEMKLKGVNRERC